MAIVYHADRFNAPAPDVARVGLQAERLGYSVSYLESGSVIIEGLPIGPIVSSLRIVPMGLVYKRVRQARCATSFARSFCVGGSGSFIGHPIDGLRSMLEYYIGPAAADRLECNDCGAPGALYSENDPNDCDARCEYCWARLRHGA